MVLLLNLAEAWALLIPAFFAVRKKVEYDYLQPVKIYLAIAFFLNAFAVAIDVYFKYHSETLWLKNNNHLYNIHSIVRFICFSVFFERLQQPFLKVVKRVLPYLSLVFVVINFTFFEKFFLAQTISSTLFAIEAGILLFYCLQYFIYLLKEDAFEKKGPDFWVVIGLSAYVVFNFPFFLVYSSLDANDQIFWWYVHNVSYLLFCIILAKAFHISRHES